MYACMYVCMHGFKLRSTSPPSVKPGGAPNPALVEAENG